MEILLIIIGTLAFVIEEQWVVVLPIGVAPPRSYAPYTVSLTAM